MALSLMCLLLIGSDFPICVDSAGQSYPAVIHAFDQYYVFWSDSRFYDPDTFGHAVFASRVASDGTVLDPGGKFIWSNQVSYGTHVATDGSNFLVVFQDSC